MVLSQATNSWEGMVVKYWMKYVQHNTERSLSFALHNLANYLEEDYSNNPLHPYLIADQRKFLERCTIPKIIERAKLDLGLDLVHNADKETLIVSYLEEFIKQREESNEIV